MGRDRRAQGRGWRRPAGRLATVGAWTVALLICGPAWAEFNPATGVVDSADAAFSYGFEGAPAGRAPTVWGLLDEVVDGERAAALYVTDEAIEGDGALLFGGETSAVHLDASAWPDELIGRRVEIRLWTRAEGTDLEATVWWAGGDPWPLFRGELFDGPVLATLTLHPSGLITDDGWRELVSGPVDFALGGRLAPDVLSLVDQGRAIRSEELGFGGSYEPGARVRVDGLEIIDLGPAAVPDARCRLPTQSEDCGAHGVCILGRCVDGAAVVGPMLSPALRQAVAERRAFELLHFNGSRTLDGQREALAERFAALPALESGHAFWSALRAIYTDSGDGHAGGPVPTLPQWASDMCTAAGEADLIPGAPARPVIYRLGRNSLSEAAAIGDTIAAIDGLDPAEWAPLTRTWHLVQGDPGSFAADTGRALMDLAALTGAELTIERCADPAGCAANDVERFTVDLSASAEAVWADGGEDQRRSTLCDYRLENLNINGISSVDHRDVDGVRVLAINGVPFNRNWRNNVGEALEDSPELLIIDQRLGYGGQVESVRFMLERILPEGFATGYRSLPATDGWDPEAAAAHFEACFDGFAAAGEEPSDFDCGDSERAAVVGGGEVAAPRRVVVLSGSVVSGNEYLLRMLQARDGVRHLAPGPTIGGFGWVLDLPALVGESAGPRMQFVDSTFETGPPGFGTGVGVPPDERIVYRQSDVLAGRDTFIEAALEWLQSEEGAR